MKTKMKTPNNSSDSIRAVESLGSEDPNEIPYSEPQESYVTYLKVRINHTRPITELDELKASSLVDLGYGSSLVVLEAIHYLNGLKIQSSSALF